MRGVLRGRDFFYWRLYPVRLHLRSERKRVACKRLKNPRQHLTSTPASSRSNCVKYILPEESRIFLSARNGTPRQHSSMRRKSRLPNGHISCYFIGLGCRSQTSWPVACRIGHTTSLPA